MKNLLLRASLLALLAGGVYAEDGVVNNPFGPPGGDPADWADPPWNSNVSDSNNALYIEATWFHCSLIRWELFHFREEMFGLVGASFLMLSISTGCNMWLLILYTRSKRTL